MKHRKPKVKLREKERQKVVVKRNVFLTGISETEERERDRERSNFEMMRDQETLRNHERHQYTEAH